MEKQKIPAWQSFRYLEVFKIEKTTPAGEILKTSPTGWFYTNRECVKLAYGRMGISFLGAKSKKL